VSESPSESMSRVVTDDVVPPGGYWTGVVRRGRTVRFTDIDGTGGAAVLLFNANEPSERYNAPDTVKIQNQIYLTAGMVLFSDLGRVLASVTADTSRHHDTLAGASDAASVSARHGSGPYRDLRNERFVNTHDNFIAALGRHALDRRDIVSNLNLFDRVEVDPGGAFRWVGPGGGAGASVDLRAEMDVLVVVSNTPHALDPAATWTTGPLRVSVLDDVNPVVDPRVDPSPERRRGIENTDRLVALRG
jgi:urea carboxylase-associated protein 2